MCIYISSIGAVLCRTCATRFFFVALVRQTEKIFTFLVSIRESPAWRDMTRQSTRMLAHRQMARIYYYDMDQQYKINSAKYNLARRVGRGIALGLYSRLRVPLYFTPTVGIKYICSMMSTLYIIYVNINETK